MKELQEKHLEEIINKQFDISWHKVRYEDVSWNKGEDMNWTWQPWYQLYKATEAEWDEFKEWLVKYLRDTIKAPKKIAERESSMLILNWWLMTLREKDNTY